MPFLKKLSHLDLPGFGLFAPSVVMLLLALQWGGENYAWRSAVIIGLLSGFGILMLAFGLWQWHQQDEASVPPRILTQRTVLSSAVLAWFAFGGLQLTTYYLPNWFQAILGFQVTRLGYYNPFLLLGTTLTSIAAGLYTTLTIYSGRAEWIGYQIISGLGIGFILQMPLIAVQAVLPLSKVSSATSIIVFSQFLGGSIFLAIGENIFATSLASELRTNLPHVDPDLIVKGGASALRHTTSHEDLQAVLVSYNSAIVDTFYLPAAGGAIAFFAAWGLEWKSVRGKGFMGSG
ncbi:MAG: hypothetical protein ASARMPRED_008245 [Alectoria sarmentosa]|nr:MAG: hypothetical protein ASARMPRED_008245 [Alectoria sarmentosa]